VNTPDAWEAAPLRDGDPTSRFAHGDGTGPLDVEPTVMATAAEVRVAPALSRATAVRLWLPAVALLQVTEYGAEVSEPIIVEPR
jgi:hypothetical protein